MRKTRICRSLLLLFFLTVLAAVAEAQPGERKKTASGPAHLYQVYKYGGPYHKEFGFIDNTGKLVIDFDRLPVTTNYVGEFHDGRALIWLKRDEDEKNFTGYNMGYIDETGQIIIATRFDYARDFSEGLAYVEKQGFHGYIDTQGKPVIKLDGLATDFQMKEGSPQGRDFHEGLAAVGTGQWPSQGYRDTSTQWSGLWGYINRSGKLVIKPEFLYADNFSEGLAGVVTDRNRKYGFINKQGQMVIEPRFQPRRGGPHGFGIGGTSYFSEGLACVSEPEGGLYGYINKKGDYAIPPQFARAIEFSEGLAWVITIDRDKGTTQKVGWIDKSGQWVIVRADNQRFAEFSPGKYSEGLVPFSVYIGEKFLWGYMDKSGAEIIKPQFDSGSNFVGGIAQVSVNNEVYGFIDKKGQFIWKLK